MKKLVLFAAIIAVVGLSACKKAATEPVATDEVTVVEETAPVVVDSTVIVTDTTVVAQ
jgi:hypothetical protein